jgi:hypothetical protein
LQRIKTLQNLIVKLKWLFFLYSLIHTFAVPKISNMKRFIPCIGLLLFALCCSVNLQAQSCGPANPGNCTPQTGLTVAGFYPSDTALPCVTDGQAYDQVISFLAPSSAEGFTIVSIKIDTIYNLPCGLCYALDEQTISGGGTGCIVFRGTSNEAAGEYAVIIYADVTVNLGFDYTLKGLNLDSLEKANYYVRVKIPGDTCLAVDTNSAGSKASDSGSIVTPTITGNTTICSGGSTTLTATGASYYGYAWSNGTFVSSIDVTEAGTYTVTVYDNCNSASASASVVVSTVNPPTITPGGPTTFCQGGSVSLTSSAGSTYHWSNGSTTQAISATQAASYTVTITNASNCSASSSPTVVTVNPNPTDTITAGGPIVFCQGGSVQLTALAGLSAYQWSNGATTQSIEVSQTQSNRVTVTDANNCTALSNTITVTANPLPPDSVIISGDTILCQGDSVMLSAPGGAGLSYLWNNMATTQSIEVNTNSRNYVVVTNFAQCTSTSTAIQVTVNPNPTATITAGGPTNFCPGDSVVLTANTETSYSWNNGGTTQSITVTATGTYDVTVQDSNGCQAVAVQVPVALYPVTAITAQPQDASTCEGGNASFTVAATGNNLHYQWLLNGNATGVVSATDTIAATSDADTGYYVAVVNGACGTDTSSAAQLSISGTVNILQQPAAQVGCSGGTITFSVLVNGASLSYQWFKNGDTLAGQTASLLSLSNISTNDAGSYLVNIGSGCGDTASEAASLTVNAADTVIMNDTICSNQTFNFNGQALDTAGTYIDTFTNVSGCDSIVVLNLTVNSVTHSFYSGSVCAGSVYDFEGQLLTAAGTYYDTLTNSAGCDSIISLTLTLLQPSQTTINAGICSGGKYVFGADTLTTGGAYHDTLQNVAGCDSIVTLNLQVNSVITTNISASICQGGTYNFNGTTLDTSGVYTDTLLAIGGCDSVVILNLTENPVLQTSITDSICAGDSIIFNGIAYTASGTVSDTLTSVAGCDSIVTLNLTVIQPVVVNMSVTVCNGNTYNFNGQELTESGTYSDTLIGSNGCDSIVVLNFQTANTLTTNLSASVCQGSSYIFGTDTLTSGGFYYDTLQAVGGCDSIIALNLSVNQPVFNQINTSICYGTSYVFGDSLVTVSGTYRDTLTGINGCDSIVTLILNVTAPPVTNTSARICYGQSYPFYSQNLTGGGTYSDTLTTLAGCDSVIVLTLTIDSLPNVTWNVSDTLCNDASHIITLPSGSPAGGTFSGTGVVDNALELASAGNPPYHVTYHYTDSLGCSDSVTIAFVVETCTGIDELTLQSSLSLYPNPTGDVLMAESVYFTGGVMPVVYDVEGREVKVNYTLQAGKITFNTRPLTAGVYFIRFSIGNSAATQRFIKVE